MTNNNSLTRIDQVFNEALKHPPNDRAAFLDAACGEDGELLSEVESLLSAASEMGEEFLEQPVLPLGSLPQGVGRGSSVGVYRILRTIGQGGMGKVYLAARNDDVFQREVAIKILKRGLDTEEIVRRFRHERQLLARLDHPHIIRILDGGTTADGLPYFVMEYVEGEPIDRYHKARKLSVRARLELFRQVCSAVEFAHQNLVVHRDLKPQNILINHRGEPKLLDFGIAKLLEPGQAPLTRVGIQPMTPNYASPEQLANGAITTASDVYSLGRLLYELLTGSHPYEAIPPGAALSRQTLEREPEPPSWKAGCRHLAADLDSIVLKALEKEPRRRYASVEQLSEDLGRYLEGQPVRARQSSVRYRLGKFLLRHRLGVAILVAVLLGIFGFGVSMMVLRDQAVQERQRAEEVTQLLVEVAASLFSLAEVRMERDEREGAEKLVRDALAIWHRRGIDDPLQAKALNNLAVLLKAKGDVESAEELYRESLAMRIRLFGEEHSSVATAKHNLAAALKDQGRYDGAEELYRESLALKVKLHGKNSPEVATTLNNLALLLMEHNNPEAADPMLHEVLRVRRQHYGPQHSKVGNVLVNLGFVARHRGDSEGAAARYGEAMRIFSWSGRETSQVANVLRHQAELRLAQGKTEEAEGAARQALEIFRHTKAAGHWRIAEAESVLGACLLALGRDQEAAPLLLRGHETLRVVKGDAARPTREALERLEQLAPENR